MELNLSKKERLKLQRKQWLLNNPDYPKNYYQENKDKIKEDKKSYYEINKDYINQYSKFYYQNNKEYYKKYNKEYYKNNKAIYYQRSLKYINDNYEKHLTYQHNYYIKKKNTNKNLINISDCIITITFD